MARKSIGKILAIAAIIGCLVSLVASQDVTSWSVDGRYIQLNGEPFLFKGINYSPIPIGASQEDDTTNRGDVFTSQFGFIHDRDLPAIRATGANSIRLYNVYPWKYPSAQYPDWAQEVDLDHSEFLDKCWNGGENPIYVWITLHMGTSFHVATSTDSRSPDGRPSWKLPNGRTAYLDPSWDQADSNNLIYMRNAFVSLAKKYGNHPAVSGFFLSNEQNTDQIRGSWQFWLWFDETAKLVKEAAPTKLTSMSLVDDALLSVFYAEGFGVQHIDLWGVNSYRGTVNSGFDVLFSSFAAKSNRPLIIGEYGPPASTRDDSGKIVLLPENAKAQGDYITVHWQDILDNRDVCSGGFVFEWVDEWWKHSIPETHDPSTAPNAAYPGGHGDEEWFGMNGVALITAGADVSAFLTRGADVLEPRFSVEAVTTMFAIEIELPPQFPETPITLVPIAPYEPLPPTTVPQNAPTGIKPVPQAPPSPNPTPSTSTPTSNPSSPNTPVEPPAAKNTPSSATTVSLSLTLATFIWMLSMAVGALVL